MVIVIKTSFFVTIINDENVFNKIEVERKDKSTIKKM